MSQKQHFLKFLVHGMARNHARCINDETLASSAGAVICDLSDLTSDAHRREHLGLLFAWSHAFRAFSTLPDSRSANDRCTVQSNSHCKDSQTGADVFSGFDIFVRDFSAGHCIFFFSDIAIQEI